MGKQLTGIVYANFGCPPDVCHYNVSKNEILNTFTLHSPNSNSHPMSPPEEGSDPP